MELPAIVTLIALLEYMFFSFRVGSSRVKFGVEAPATSGHPEWERMFRGQQNTLEVVNLRQVGGAALANQRVLEALGVSRRQRDELRSNRERVAEQMLRLRKESFDEALGVLTPEQIEKLDELRQRGVLSQQEFDAKKADLLGRM